MTPDRILRELIEKARLGYPITGKDLARLDGQATHDVACAAMIIFIETVAKVFV